MCSNVDEFWKHFAKLRKEARQSFHVLSDTINETSGCQG